MKAAAILGTAVLLTGVAVDAQAKTSSSAEYRGFSACVDAVDGDLAGLVTAREYLISRTPEMNQYYINGTAWSEGERVDVRVACDTTRNGRRLLDVSFSEGTYVLDEGQVNVRVASN